MKNFLTLALKIFTLVASQMKRGRESHVPTTLLKNEHLKIINICKNFDAINKEEFTTIFVLLYGHHFENIWFSGHMVCKASLQSDRIRENKPCCAWKQDTWETQTAGVMPRGNVICSEKSYEGKLSWKKWKNLT